MAKETVTTTAGIALAAFAHRKRAYTINKWNNN
jgi:hypothetical protein